MPYMMAKSNSNNILLVGGGITSSLITFLLRNHARYVFDVWEAHEEIGGRMRTLRNESSSIDIDLGAQYITTDEAHMSRHHMVYDSLISNNILTPLTCHIENLRTHTKNNRNYVAPGGMSSLVKHLFANSNVRNIRTAHPVECLDVQDHIVSPNNGKEEFNAVILTPPVPDILEIRGSFKETESEDVLQKLRQIKYSSRFVLVMMFDQALNVPWAATYMPQDQIFRYVAIQEKKVGARSCHSSVVFHTSVEFGTQYGEAEDAELVLVNHVRRIFPQWPEATRASCYKWNHSQVTSPYVDSPTTVTLRTDPPVIITGDGFSASNFDGCIQAGTSTVNTLLTIFANR